MSPLAAIVQSMIVKRGAITIADYMELALQHPDYGYYRKGDPLGSEGDFITAPEISQMFGEMIGLWCVDAWRQTGKPSSFTLLEMGAGRGTLMQDVLRATERVTEFQDAFWLHLLESNATLRGMQQEKLARHAPIFIDDLNNLPPEPIIFIANEFFDALPIRQFEHTFQGWVERMVTVQGDEFVMSLQPLDAAVLGLVPVAIRDTAQVGRVYEISMPSLVIIRKLAKHIATHGGVGLVIDYGFMESSGAPTLQAVHQHKYAKVLENVGGCDLTAHVDFGGLRDMAATQGCSTFGAVGQGEFLLALGIELRAGRLKQHATPDQVAAIDGALHRLTAVSEMGSLFKVLAIAAPTVTNLLAF